MLHLCIAGIAGIACIACIACIGLRNNQKTGRTTAFTMQIVGLSTHVQAIFQSK